MRSRIGFAAFSVLMAGSSVMARDGGSLDPVGTWLTEDGRAKVHIDRCGPDHAHICGTIAWLKDPLDDKGHPKIDVKNPDPAKRIRPLLGLELLYELKPDDDDVFGGQIYNAENGKNYEVTMKVEKPSDLHVKGCMLSILCGSQHWTRVADLPATVVATTQGKGKTKPVAPAE